MEATQTSSKCKTLHFKVHPNILNIIRQAYWFEEGRKEWAMSCLDVCSSGQLTLELTNKLLEGDAYFITKDSGITLSVVREPDTKFKKELKEWRAWKAEEVKCVKKAIPEEDCDSEFVVELEKDVNEKANKNIAIEFFIKAHLEETPEGKKACLQLTKEFSQKVYDFIFKGHHYTFNDAARHQGMCPHCGMNSPDGSFWQESDKAFIGKAKLGSIMYARCFECPNCFNKFFYHYAEHEKEPVKK